MYTCIHIHVCILNIYTYTHIHIQLDVHTSVGTSIIWTTIAIVFNMCWSVSRIVIITVESPEVISIAIYVYDVCFMCTALFTLVGITGIGIA